MGPVHALLRHLAEFGKLAFWVTVISLALVTFAAVVLAKGLRSRLVGRREPRAAHAG